MELGRIAGEGLRKRTNGTPYKLWARVAGGSAHRSKGHKPVETRVRRLHDHRKAFAKRVVFMNNMTYSDRSWDEQSE